MNKLQIGDKITTKVIAIGKDCIFLDLNAKSDGVLPLENLRQDMPSPKVGDEVVAIFIGEVSGEPRFTLEITGDAAADDMLEKAFNNQLAVAGKFSKEIKGGYEVLIGQKRAFCPYSQVFLGQRGQAAQPIDIIGKTVDFFITQYKENGKDLVVSHKAVVDLQKQQAKALAISSIKEGDIVDATVTSLHSYGAFVDINGISALLPVSEASYDKTKKLQDIVTQGQKIKVCVLKTDWQNNKISVSLKATQADPWGDILQKHKAGDILTGTITKIMPFGLFVQISQGIEGLLHISKLGVSFNTNLAKKYKIGESIEVLIEAIDTEAKKIELNSATQKTQEKQAQEYQMQHTKDDTGDMYNPFAVLLKK